MVEDHLFIIGIDPTYTEWIFHGEDNSFLDDTFSDDEGDNALAYNDYIDDFDEMLDDIRHRSFMDNSTRNEGNANTNDQPSTSNTPTNLNFEELVVDAQRPLYPSCAKFSKLLFIVKLLHIKSIGGWTVKSFDMVIKLLQAAFPHALFPDSFNDARCLERDLGFSYKKIHVRPNDCALFWKENAEYNECPKCKASRWIVSTNPRNVSIGLASDGFNPFNNMSKPYSIWPVLLVPYNLPPWSYMKDPYTMLSLLIPDPKAPGNDIDVFLLPLINELRELWEEGIHTYDVYNGQMFRLHAVLLWTINDFPAHANLFGWSTKGKMACPSCTSDTYSQWLVYGHKLCYMGHQRWLAYNGYEEHQVQPSRVEGEDLLEQLCGLSHVQIGKSSLKRK
ncbi:uncharacterized protein LOC121253397 [Juglans microcarpa x Juglans regia]|uniref:uncharacterized protein LOC121253397 n=1 Tax=Juglans microcarpa x Juglans regia TaxID=2249226 RepID=UPI001B7F6D6A|nr:uncharacterized protein LOC121253397 [Juglans microcarpa x Juglans regia]